MIDRPTLTPERKDALTAVDLKLIGVTHGITRTGLATVEGITDADFVILKAATDQLNPARGDVLAIEPTGFVALDDPPTVASIIPVALDKVPVKQLPQEVHDQLAELLEYGRSQQIINNLAYVATHALLKDIPVHIADTTLDEWKALLAKLGTAGHSEATEKKIKLAHRHGKMLTKLGDIAIDMVDRLGPGSVDAVLLFASGSTHTPYLEELLNSCEVSFTTLPGILEGDSNIE